MFAEKKCLLKQTKSSDSVCIHCLHIVFSVCLGLYTSIVNLLINHPLPQKKSDILKRFKTCYNMIIVYIDNMSVHTVAANLYNIIMDAHCPWCWKISCLTVRCQIHETDVRQDEVALVCFARRPLGLWDSNCVIVPLLEKMIWVLHAVLHIVG